ncbi:MAG: hypothetical protein IJC56_10420 [Clostridia bacterium]|nr:hypothetical protein [Clostridia bacterium]
MRQRVSNPKLKWWQGVLLIVGIVFILMVFQFFASVVSFMTGDMNNMGIASLAFWIFGGVIALYLVRRFIMEYEYSIEGINFKVSRIYSGLRPREAVSIVTRSIEAVGTPEEVQAKFPGSHHSAFTRSKCELPVMAVAYRDDGRLRVIHIQPEEAFLEKLRNCVGK